MSWCPLHLKRLHMPSIAVGWQPLLPSSWYTRMLGSAKHACVLNDEMRISCCQTPRFLKHISHQKHSALKFNLPNPSFPLTSVVRVRTPPYRRYLASTCSAHFALMCMGTLWSLKLQHVPRCPKWREDRQKKKKKWLKGWSKLRSSKLWPKNI